MLCKSWWRRGGASAAPYTVLYPQPEELDAFHAICRESEEQEVDDGGRRGRGGACDLQFPPGRPLAGCQDGPTFFRRLYRHFYRRGLAAVVAAHLTATLLAFFSFGLAMLLLFGVKWSLLATCCAAATPVTDVIQWEPSVPGALLLALFLAWRAVEAARTVVAILAAVRMRGFYRDTLGLSTRQLQCLRWEEVVTRLQERWPAATHGPAPTALQVARAISAEDDLVVALLNDPGADLFPPWAKPLLVTRSLVWWVRMAVVRGVGRTLSDRAAHRRLAALAALTLTCLPLTLPAALALAAFQYAEDVQTRRAYLGSREWSPAALWAMREFGELPHVFERRTAGAYQHVAAYLRQFSSPMLTLCARAASYVAALLVATLLALAAFREPAAVALTLAGRNMVWYAVVLTTGLALARAWVPEPQDAVLDAEGTMHTLAAYTHVLPVGSPRHLDARDAVLLACPPRLLLLLCEVVGVLLTPWLLYRWAGRARHLRGALACSQAYGALDEAARAQAPAAFALKVEKSALSFWINHGGCPAHGLPAWVPAFARHIEAMEAGAALPAGLAASFTTASPGGGGGPAPTAHHLLPLELYFYWFNRWATASDRPP